MGHNAPERPAWRPWAIWPPCLLGTAWSVLAVMVVVLVEAMTGAEGGPPVSNGWLLADFIGQVIMVAASLALLAAGIRPAWRRRAAIAAWLIIPVSSGWFALTVALAGS